jgi:hypothetical protein
MQHNINASNIELIIAAERGDIFTIEELLKRKDLDETNKGWALEKAAAFGFKDVVGAFLDKGNLSSRYYKVAALKSAIVNRQNKVLYQLVTDTRFASKALKLSVEASNLGAIKAIFNGNYQPEEIAIKNALKIAIAKKKKKIIEVLLEHI